MSIDIDQPGLRARRDTVGGTQALNLIVGCLNTFGMGRTPTWEKYRSRPGDPTPIYDGVAAGLFTAEAKHPLRAVPMSRALLTRVPIPSRPLSYQARAIRCTCSPDDNGHHDLVCGLRIHPSARRTDPDTSHQAARSVRTDSDAHKRILALFRILDRYRVGFTDEQLLIVWQEARIRDTDWPRISQSGLRTRRKELSDAGLLVASDQAGRTASGRACIVWRLA